MDKEQLDASLGGLNDPGHGFCTLATVNVAVVCLYTLCVCVCVGALIAPLTQD